MSLGARRERPPFPPMMEAVTAEADREEERHTLPAGPADSAGPPVAAATIRDEVENDGSVSEDDRAEAVDDVTPIEVQRLEHVVRTKFAILQRELARVHAVCTARPRTLGGDSTLADARRRVRDAIHAIAAYGDAVPPTDEGVAAAGDDMATTACTAVDPAVTWVEAHGPTGQETLLASRARRAAALDDSTARGMDRRSADGDPRRAAPAACADMAKRCAACRSPTHTARAKQCPVQRLRGGYADAHDRGGDPAATDPLASWDRVTHTVSVSLATVLAAMCGGEDADAQNALSEAFEAMSEQTTQLHATMRLVFICTVLTLLDEVGAAGWEAVLPNTKATWDGYWN